MSWTVFHKRGLEGFRNEFFQKVFRLNMDGDLTVRFGMFFVLRSV